MGFGIVGSGTVELFYRNRESLCRKLGTDIDIKYILDLRKFPGSPFEDKITDDFEKIASDPEITAVAELMGGTNPALEYTERLLSRGVSVVTSNKELVARHGAKLLKIAREHGCNYLFEASTGGAIPIIRPLHECLVADRIHKIEGILNGTTNFILTRILDDNMPFPDALKLSQDLGYAERDPAADISGADACRKICILASLAFGRHVYPEWVFTKGIDHISPVDASYAESYGARIKLIGSAQLVNPEAADTDKRLMVTVEPQFVCNGNQIAHVNDVFNAVSVFTEAAGELMFFGRGAGKLPTASAVLGDIMAACEADKTSATQYWEDSESPDFIVDKTTVKRSFYVRVQYLEKRAFSVNNIFPEAETLTFTDANINTDNEAAFTVPNITESELREKLRDFRVITILPIKE
jgi:homoserine dehydrogenase